MVIIYLQRARFVGTTAFELVDTAFAPNCVNDVTSTGSRCYRAPTDQLATNFSAHMFLLSYAFVATVVDGAAAWHRNRFGVLSPWFVWSAVLAVVTRGWFWFFECVRNSGRSFWGQCNFRSWNPVLPFRKTDRPPGSRCTQNDAGKPQRDRPKTSVPHHRPMLASVAYVTFGRVSNVCRFQDCSLFFDLA